ncbi:enkurin, partial [Kipferlia bialata]
GQKVVRISDRERTEMLEGLRANWTASNKEFMEMHLVVDTLKGSNRRQLLEDRLADLERNIAILEKGEVYVVLE